jgi:hypothetical protein
MIRNATAIPQREKKELVATVTSYVPTLAEYETRDRSGRLQFLCETLIQRSDQLKGTYVMTLMS